MANRCRCPPVASRGLFKYLTYLIPIRECSQHRGPGIVYRGFVKLREGASAANYYINSIPVGSIASYLNSINFSSNILNCIIAKCSFFLNVIKPPLEKIVLYVNSYYSTEYEAPNEEAKSVCDSIGKVSKSISKQTETETVSIKSVSTTKSRGTAKSTGLEKPTISEKSTGLEKPTISEKSAGLEKPTSSEKSAGLEKPTISEKSAGSEKPTVLEKIANLEKSMFSEKPPFLEMPTFSDKATGSAMSAGSVKSTGSAKSSDIKIEVKPGQVKTVKVSVKQPEPAVPPCCESKGLQLKSKIRRSLNSVLEAIQYVFNVILSTLQYVFNVILSTLQYVFSAILRPFRYASTGMADILRGTKDRVVSAGSCSFNYLASCPLWVYIYILFVSLTVAYIVYQTYITYKGRLWSQANKVSARIREGCKEFIIPDSTLKQVMAKLRTEIDKGLNPKTKPSSSVKCFTTYVQDLPTGEENGKFLALDLGGTNFRVLLITLNGRHFDMQSKIYVIPQDVMVGTSKNLFNHIAVCLADFTMEHKVNKDNLPLGFTFSFPLKQEGLSKGVLQRWTKGFNCPEAIGQDVVELLREAIDSHGDLHIDIMAILNDTTGTLMSCAWKNHNTKIGVILGTGTNACYVEKIENVIDFDGDKSKPIVLINTEWGAFGDNGELDFIRTSYDKDVDSHSINPGSQIHEKLISGMYLGEIVRLLLVKFISEKLIFDGRLNEQIQQRGSLPTKFLSEVESDKRGCFKECKKALARIGYTQVTDEDCNSVRFVCECVSRRAAHLASAALATLINKMGYPSLTIGVDGSLYRFHPHFHDLMVQKISQLIDDKIMEFSIMLSSDGSGRGAALVAASLSTSPNK